MSPCCLQPVQLPTVPTVRRRRRHSFRSNRMRMCHAMMMMMMILVVMVTTLQCCIPGVSAVRNLQIVLPLQSLTIWDPETQTSSSAQSATDDATTTADATTVDSYFRSKFLSTFRMGLQAEMQVRKLLQQQLPNSNSINNSNSNNSNDSKSNSGKRNRNKRTNGDTTTNNNNNNNNSKDWAIRAARRDQQQHLAQEKLVEQAYDDATRQRDNASIPDQQQPQHVSTTTITTKNRNPYQFVGVITTHTNRVEQQQQQPPIVWYTRKKPPHAKWTVRLIHPNRDAIIKDLYDHRKIDIFAKYTNLGIPSSTTTTTKASSQPVVATTNTNTASYQPLIQSQYIVRERSWKNLWNMSWKHIWTDSSGMYWRERRLSSTAATTWTTTPQLYTDGQNVYEATYRYRDGRNGMHKVSSMTEFLNSRSIDTKMKQRILRRLAKDVPDVVIEE
jgi:hypothetical protein